MCASRGEPDSTVTVYLLLGVSRRNSGSGPEPCECLLRLSPWDRVHMRAPATGVPTVNQLTSIYRTLPVLGSGRDPGLWESSGQVPGSLSRTVG